MFLPAGNNQAGSRKLILLLIISVVAVVLVSPVSAESEFAITANGDQLYYVGEEVILRGYNFETNSTSLFIIGPNLPGSGGKLSAPFQPVASGDPGSFITVPTGPDNTWEYYLYTSPLGIGPGIYTIYAVNQSKTHDELADATYNTVSVILKKPFITTEIIPTLVAKGQPFRITGFAEGNPEYIQLWMFGDHNLVNAKIPVNSDSSYSLTVDPELSDNFPEGQWYLVLQHPMQNNNLDIVLDGDWIRTQRLDNGTGSLLIRGEGASQGWYAAQNFFSNFDHRSVDDTYIVIPFVVDDSGITSYVVSDDAVYGPSAPGALPGTAVPVVVTIPVPTQAALFPYIPAGALILVAWCSRQGPV
jgi:hypothetical protein